MDDLRIHTGAITRDLTLKADAPLETLSSPGDPSFVDVLKQSIEKVNALQMEADQSVQDLTLGKAQNLHETMIAMEKASASFNMMMQVKNKIVTAYEEVMRMQV